MDKNIFIISGIMRVGNHAVINWIMKQLVHDNKSVVFFNNILPEDWPEVKVHRIFQLSMGCCPANVEKHGKEPFQYIIKSYEEVLPQRVPDHGEKSQRIVVLRDPYNWLSSKMGLDNSNDFSEEFIRHLHQSIHVYIETFKYAYVPNVILVNFNKWTSDVMYRKNICNAININFNDQGFYEIPVYGGGSTFRENANNAKELKVMNRWENRKNDKLYLQLLEDYPALQEINELMFKFPIQLKKGKLTYYE